jgi:hypothetical protein
MSLSREQFARAAQAEERQQRVERMLNMNYADLYGFLINDSREAAVWVRSAAEFGIAAAQLRFGRVLLDGVVMPRDAAQALYWFQRAAEQGCADAMNMVGRCFENAWGVARDLVTAAKRYEASALAGHDWGQYNYGNMLFDGRGLDRDQPLALGWYERAALQGHARAMNLLGRAKEQGWGCERNPAAACDWYRRAARAGYFRAQYNYALVLLELRRFEEAAHWFTQAADERDRNVLRAIVAALGHAKQVALQAACERALEHLQQLEHTG